MAVTKNFNARANGHIIKSINVSRALCKLATADFKCNKSFNAGDDVTLSINNTIVFIGIVKSCEASGDNNMFRISAEATASNMFNKYFNSENHPNVVFKYRNPDNDTLNTIGYYFSKLPSCPIQSPNDHTDYSSMTVIPGTDIDLPDIQFGRSSIYTAYESIFKILNLPYWYVDGSVVPSFGKCRELEHLVFPKDFIISSYRESQSYIPKYDSVIVVDDDKKHFGCAGEVDTVTGVMTGAVQVVYQYGGKHTKDTLTAMANSILKSSGYATSRWVVTFEPGAALQFREGDIISGIGDETASPEIMPYMQGSVGTNISGYRVDQIEIRNDATILYLGSTRTTVFDVYKDRLNIVDNTGIYIDEYNETSGFKGLDVV